MKLYHGSPNKIMTPFNALSHFGTRKAAVERLQSLSKDYSSDGYGRNCGWVHSVELDIRNPLKIRDGFYMSHTPLKLADMLYYELSVITAFERAEIIKNRVPALIMALTRRGYDSMVYINLHEDIHSLSYVILRPEQAKVTEVEKVWFGLTTGVR